MTTCPRCGQRAWHYGQDPEGEVWTCPNGHHTHQQALQSSGAVLVVDRPWLIPVLSITGSGVLTLILNILLN